MEPEKYEYIDSLRGIAILLVILVHSGYYMYDNELKHFYPTGLYQFIRNGQFGVQLFFIMSALTLTMSWHNRADETNKKLKFFIRRFFRIAPLFYIAIIYFTFDKFVGFDLSNIDLSNIALKKMITSFLFINGFFPTYINGYVPGGWSITIEFMFYALVPFLLTRIKGIHSSINFVLISLMVCFFINTYLIGSLTNNNEFIYYNFISQFPVFELGILCYWILKDNSELKSFYRSNLIVLCLTVFIFCYMTIPYHFLYSLIFVLIIVIQSYHPSKLFSNKILAQIGKVSFSMYLVHFAIVSIFERINWPSILPVTSLFTSIFYLIVTYLVITVISFLISTITYKTIEIPGQNLGRKIIKILDK